MKIKHLIKILAFILILNGCYTAKKSALKHFKSGKPKVLVCPVHILNNQNSSHDTLSSHKIVEYLNDNNYAKSSFTNKSPVAYTQWQRNEAAMLTESIKLFMEFVKAKNFEENTYILYPEFYKRGRESAVWAVHYCLLNNKAEIVMRGLLNSKWEEFQKVNPKTNEDCVDVFKNGFDNQIK